MDEELRDRLEQVARTEVEHLPYELEGGAETTLRETIAMGVQRMESEGRDAGPDLAEAEESLRGLLRAAQDQVSVRSTGESVLLPDGFTQMTTLGRWWPFT